ncbi:MAG: hypothetical protein JWN57_2703 [Frankiales bacterium]|jgi:hypothetical protein|nr:hypothetical protein [Frankiales bacterium]
MVWRMTAPGLARRSSDGLASPAGSAPQGSPLEDDLREDHLTAWAPDALGWVDLPEARALGTLDPSPAVHWLPVPSMDGQIKVRPLLSPAMHAALHDAVAPLRDPAEELLAAGVCGYRTGASGGSYYSREFSRFQEFTAGEAEGGSHVIFADVESFFANLPLPGVLATAQSVVGNELPQLRAVFQRLIDAGLLTLPAGYADARMLANLVLADVDSELPVQFARWVDDYRLFVPAGMPPERVLASLAFSLSRRGLHLNPHKTRVMNSASAVARGRDSLTSVYHPDRGDSRRDRASLRSVFFAAAADPVRHRRALRFALRRLMAETDDVAVDWSLAVLPQTRWEAPRLVAYLGAFLEQQRVRDSSAMHLKVAAEAGDAWLVARLAPMASLGTHGDTLNALQAFVQTTESSAAWGLGLRVLARNGRSEVVEREANRLLDPRAAVGALGDVGLASDRANAAAPTAATALRRAKAPAPQLESIL